MVGIHAATIKRSVALLSTRPGVIQPSRGLAQGRAVGALGIIIAGFGVLGEAYQFTALMLV